MSEQQWYFISVVNQEQYGPYSADQLEGFAKSGSITKETMIWTEALKDQWIPASNVEGLFPSPQDPPPATQPAQPAQPARPQLLTGPASQAAQALQTAPLQAQPPQAAPVHPAAAPIQPAAAPIQPAAAPMQPAAAPMQPAAPIQQAPAARRPVAPGMIPSSMPGAAQVTQTASAAPTPGQALPGRVAPGEPFPAPPPAKASFGMYLGTFLGGFGLLLLALLFDSALLVGLGLLGGYALMLWSSILSYIYLYRAWSMIQPGNVRTSPGKAIGFLFIPFFNIYWVFVAVGGLPREWNRVMSSHPNLSQAPRLSSGLAIAACLVPLLFIPLMSAICKGVNWMGRLNISPAGGGGPTGPLGGLSPGGASPQAGGGIRLY